MGQDNFWQDNFIRNPNVAFKNAIARGLINPEQWMYMYSSSKKGIDFFKHHITREYITFTY